MSDDVNATAEDQSRSADGQDWFLQEIVALTNRVDDLHLPITLCVSGFLVSGALIGGRAYFDQITDQLLGDTEKDGSINTVDKFFRSFGDIYDEIKDDPSALPPAYIHLKDARIFAPGAPATPANQGVLWRGRLAAVDGFWMGSLSTVEG